MLGISRNEILLLLVPSEGRLEQPSLAAAGNPNSLKPLNCITIAMIIMSIMSLVMST